MNQNWYIFDDVAVTPTRYGTIIIDADALPEVSRLSWHVRSGKHLYVRAWLDSRRESDKRGRAIYLHDLLTPRPRGVVCDFHNGNRLDCRRENLRPADKSEDNCNRSVTRSNTGHLGVTYSEERGKYVAQISFRGKWQHLGRHDTLDEAIAARAQAARSLHGDFASPLNFTKEPQ